MEEAERDGGGGGRCVCVCATPRLLMMPTKGAAGSFVSCITRQGLIKRKVSPGRPSSAITRR